jgi:hypothetical protein
MADTKIKPQHQPAKSFLKSPVSLYFLVPSCLSGYKSIMQNKANVKMGNINISTARTKTYANEQRTMSNERHSKQTQSKPISNDQSQFQTQKQLTPLPSREIAPARRAPGGEARATLGRRC